MEIAPAVVELGAGAAEDAVLDASAGMPCTNCRFSPPPEKWVTPKDARSVTSAGWAHEDEAVNSGLGGDGELDA
jgi:hypothetical protein